MDTFCKNMFFLQCDWECGSSDLQHNWTTSYTYHKYEALFLCLCKSPDGVALFALLQMWKGFVAFSANIWPSSVYQHVRLQMFRSMKRFDALDTIITLCSSMNQAVYFQSLSKIKYLIASSACVIFRHCGLTCEFSSAPPDGISFCIQHNCRAFPHYVSPCDPLDGGLPEFLIDVQYVWTIFVLFLPTMNKKMLFQTPSLNVSSIALSTIIWFFSTVSNKCNQCDYATTLAGNLRRHLIKYSGERWNKCKNLIIQTPRQTMKVHQCKEHR